MEPSLRSAQEQIKIPLYMFKIYGLNAGGGQSYFALHCLVIWAKVIVQGFVVLLIEHLTKEKFMNDVTQITGKGEGFCFTSTSGIGHKSMRDG